MRGGGKVVRSAPVALLFVAAFLFLFTSTAAADYIVEITSPEDGEVVAGIVTIQGILDLNGEPEPDGVSVEINGTWRDATDTGNGSNWTSWEYVWRSGRVENGPFTIQAAARDGFDLRGITSVDMIIDNAPPVAEITRTQPNSSVAGRIVTLHGTAVDIGSGSDVATYLWESDIDGTFGYTKNITAFLSAGVHYITFRIENDIGSWSEKVHVNVTMSDGGVWDVQGADLTNTGAGGEPFDLANIEPGWFYATGERDALQNVVPATGQVITGSVVTDHVVYTVLENGTVIALDPHGLFDGVQGKMLDSADILWTVHLDELTSGAILHHEDVLYIGTEMGNLHALNATTGAHDVWAEGSKRWVGGGIGHNAFTVVENYLVFGSYDEIDTAGEIWCYDLSDGDMVDLIQIDKRPIQKPVPVGDFLLQPIYAKADGILIIDINRKGEMTDHGRLDIPHYVMGVSADGGLLTIVTRPSNTTGVIYLYNYGLEEIASYSSDLEYYDPAAIADGRILVAGVFHERYSGGQTSYVYERGYLQVFDDELNLVDEFEIDGTPSYQPTILGGTVLMSTYNGSLYAYDIGTGDAVDGWPIDYSAYGRGASNQTFSTTQIIPFGDALAFGSFDSVFYTLGGEVIKPIAKVIDVTPPEDVGAVLETWNGARTSFEGEGSSLAGRDIISYLWTSDIDGAIGQSATFSAKLSPGEHRISFQVTDDSNITSIPVNFTYTVNNNSLPIARITNIGSVGSVEAGEPLFIYLSHSYDPDDPDEEITFRVDFGEGVNWTFNGIVLDNVWERPGTYLVNITPIDSHGVVGLTVQLSVEVVEAEDETSELSMLFILAILVMVIVIIALAGAFVAVKRRAPEPAEDEPPAGEEKAPEPPSEAPPPAKRRQPAITPPLDAVEGMGVEDVTFDELAKRVQVLVDHQRELEDDMTHE